VELGLEDMPALVIVEHACLKISVQMHCVNIVNWLNPFCTCATCCTRVCIKTLSLQQVMGSIIFSAIDGTGVDVCCKWMVAGSWW